MIITTRRKVIWGLKIQSPFLGIGAVSCLAAFLAGQLGFLFLGVGLIGLAFPIIFIVATSPWKGEDEK